VQDQPGREPVDVKNTSPWLLPPTPGYLQAMSDAENVAARYLLRIWFRKVHGRSAPYATFSGVSVRNWTGFHPAT
jgi:hypothetical protein